MCESEVMGQTVCVLPPTDQRLLAIVADRNRPLKHVQRAQSSFVRRIACLCRKWRGARTSADPRSGAGKRDTLSRASMACCATRRANPAVLRFRPRSSPRLWT